MVTTNDGTVILQGLGAQFSALAPLATNNGTFDVQSAPYSQRPEI